MIAIETEITIFANIFKLFRFRFLLNNNECANYDLKSIKQSKQVKIETY